MKASKNVGFLTGVLSLVYGVYVLGILVSMLAGFGRQIPPVIDPWVLAALDMIVYFYLGAQILRGRREPIILVVFWTIFGVALTVFGFSYRNDVLNLFSFLIVFFGTYYHVTVTKPDVAVTRSLGLLAGILALVQGIYVAFTTVLDHTPARFTPELIGAVITVAVYIVSGVGILRNRKEFFLLAILWTLLESALAAADSTFVRSHFNIFSILILAFSTYYYFSKTKT